MAEALIRCLALLYRRHFVICDGCSQGHSNRLAHAFFTGFFGSAPVTNTGGVLLDIWSPEQRGMAMVGYAIAVVGGPTIAPVIGGAIASSHLQWRWTEYLMGIVIMAQLVLKVIILDESYVRHCWYIKRRDLGTRLGTGLCMRR